MDSIVLMITQQTQVMQHLLQVSFTCHLATFSIADDDDMALYSLTSIVSRNI